MLKRLSLDLIRSLLSSCLKKILSLPMPKSSNNQSDGVTEILMSLDDIVTAHAYKLSHLICYYHCNSCPWDNTGISDAFKSYHSD